MAEGASAGVTAGVSGVAGTAGLAGAICVGVVEDIGATGVVAGGSASARDNPPVQAIASRPITHLIGSSLYWLASTVQKCEMKFACEIIPPIGSRMLHGKSRDSGVGVATPAGIVTSLRLRRVASPHLPTQRLKLTGTLPKLNAYRAQTGTLASHEDE